jgi:hypothetical protein
VSARHAPQRTTGAAVLCDDSAVPRAALAFALGLALGCSTPPSAPTPAARPTTALAIVVAPTATVAIAPPTATVEAPAAPSDRITADAAEALLFPGATATDATVLACRRATGDDARIRCLLAARYVDDAVAAGDALALYRGAGSVAGLLPEEHMDGGFRGQIHLVPEAPIGKERRHLAWITAASADFDAFFTELARGAKAPLRYRSRDLAYRFFRSVKRTTPSAYADGWSVAYNVAGSLNTSADAVRETLFHEIFHLDDAAHGDWSARALRPTFDAIVQRCGTRDACLGPYAPNDTRVRGGTYYAFQPNNGDAVHEYAAELALRYYRENRAAIRGEAASRATTPRFKCGPDENRRAWEALAGEFFGGADRTPDCAR